MRNMMTIVGGFVAAGVTLGCAGRTDVPVGGSATTAGSGGESGSGGTGGTGGGVAWTGPAKLYCDTGGTAPTQTIDCATSLSTWPPPPDAPSGVRVALGLPPGSCLVDVRAKIAPVMGHKALPAILPGFFLIASPVGDPSTLAVLETVQDKAMTVGAYETPHSLDMPAPAPGFYVDPGAEYAVLSFSEMGTNAKSGGTSSGWECVIQEVSP